MTFTTGMRVRFTSDLERFPHFHIPKGTLGTVTSAEGNCVSVRPDDKIKGMDAWDNEALVGGDLDDNAPCTRYLEVIPGGTLNSDFTAGAKVRFTGDTTHLGFAVPPGTTGVVESAESHLTVVVIQQDAPCISGLAAREDGHRQVQFDLDLEVLSDTLEIAQRGYRVGDKVRFAQQCDRTPDFTIPAGATGVVTMVDECQVNVRVDEVIPEMAEWENEVAFLPDHSDLEVLELVP